MVRVPFTLSLICGQLARLVFPALVLSVALSLLNEISVVFIPGWVIVIASLACIFPYHIVAAKFRYWKNCRKAAQLGAIMPPRWKGKAIGNRDVLQLLDDAFRNGYLSRFSLQLVFLSSDSTLSPR